MANQMTSDSKQRNPHSFSAQLARRVVTSRASSSNPRHFTHVCEVGRRVTPAEDLPAKASGKMEQKAIDFERLEEAGLKEGQWDVIFIACV